MEKQATDAEFRSHCQEVIDNNGTKEAVYGQVDLLLQKLGFEKDMRRIKE